MENEKVMRCAPMDDLVCSVCTPWFSVALRVSKFFP